MKERPILFYGHEIPPTLEGRKTQFRRVVKPQPPTNFLPWNYDGANMSIWTMGGKSYPEVKGCDAGDVVTIRNPYGVPGDILIVEGTDLRLENTGVRVERVQEISREDALAEGVWPNEQPPKTFSRTYGDTMPVHLFGGLWDSINAKRGFGWDKNPWVWVIEFRRGTKA